MHPIDLILKKREGRELSSEEIQFFVSSVVHREAPGAISEAQLGAFLMAVYQRGLSLRETAELTRAMRFSGEVFDTWPLHTFSIDKHSTGGVGDKTSLLIAPVLAAAGLQGKPSISVPMISGRSLGHTGGTLDKLETIPGFNTQLSLAEMTDVLRRCHAVMIGQTPQLVPADRILYALRDHTGTVESPYLICASIMSKKLAEDLDGLVLDVKTGSGAFLPTVEAARHLAQLMVATGEASGTRTVALLTAMDEPLGRFAGNWVEVWECVDILQGRRHPRSADLIELTLALCGWMLHLAGRSATPAAGAELADELLQSGAAWQAWLRIVEAQGGDPAPFADPASFHRPAATQVIAAEGDAYLASMDCKQVGWAVQRLGAGRSRPGDPVSAHAGIECHVRLGDLVRRGQPLFTAFAEEPSLLDEACQMLAEAVHLAQQPPQLQPLVREIVGEIPGESVGEPPTQPAAA